MTAKIKIDNLDITIPVNPTLSLLNNLLYHDQHIRSVCGGRAQCGSCRVRIESGQEGLSPVSDAEKSRLSPKDLKDGWRLACQAHVSRDVSIYLPPALELKADYSKQ